jgi:GH43 family beta-xylosidase
MMTAAGSARRRGRFGRGLRAAMVGLALAGVVASIGMVATPAQAATSYTNPVKSQKGADPWLVFHDGNYYLISTTFTNTLVMRKSPTLAGLATAPSVQVWQDTTPSRGTNFWAPEIHMFNGRWYLYYSAGQVGAPCCDTQRTHVLESAGSDPLGPYTYRNILTGSNLNTNGWLIDASVLQVNGGLYLLGSASIGNSGQSLVIAPMSNPFTLSSSTFSLISRPTLSWEVQGFGVNEGAVALQRNGRTMIVYSASFCGTPDYKLGLLTLTGGNPLAMASWTKSPNPVFQRSDANGVFGPGHNGFFRSPNGAEDWIVYHANSSAGGGCDNGRTTRAQRFTWNADNTPNFGTPVRTGTSLAAPAGEMAATPTAYTIVNRNSGKCLDLADGSSADGANVRLWTCNGSTAQRWRFEDQADDTSRIVNVASGKVLDVANCGSADGTDIRQWTWLNNTCQRFRAVITAGGFVRLQNQATGKVADVAGCGTADGTDVRQWTWLNNTCQQWSLNPV